MIARTWLGWTTTENADSYETVFRTIVLPHLNSVEGCQDAYLFRRRVDDEVEFLVLMVFESIEAVKAFAGEDFESAVISDEAKQVLKRFAERVKHYEIVETKK